MKPNGFIRDCKRSIDARIGYLKAELEVLQDRCEHPNVIKIHKGDTGNWCVSDDSYWTEFRCPDCVKSWTEEGSK
jgi:hypothetical protein